MLPEASEHADVFDTEFPLVFVLSGAAFVVLVASEMFAEGVGHSHGHTDPETAPLVPEEESLKSESTRTTSFGGSENSPHSTQHSGNVYVVGMGRPRVRSSAVLVLLASLVGHSVIEGLVLGLEDEELAAIGVFIAILVHKFFEGAALGTSAKGAGWSTARCTFVFVTFALSSPIGVIVGMQLSETSVKAETILRALASGAFFYLGGWHLPRHAAADIFSTWVVRVGWSFYGVGFTIMSILGLFHKHHDHHD